MSNLLTTLRRPASKADESRLSFSDYLSLVAGTYSFGGNSYTLPIQFTQTGKKQTPIPNQYLGFAGAFRDNIPLFAVMMSRARLFTEAEFIWQDKRTRKLFGDPSLAILEEPWPNGTTGDLLMLAEMMVSLGGNCYLTFDNGRLRVLRPDWVTILLSSQYDPDNPAFAWDAEIKGYIYQPINTQAEHTVPQFFTVEQMSHWTPIPDPVAPWRGMAWLTPVIRELMADAAATEHKLSFFENSATPNLAIKLPESVTTEEQFKEITQRFENSHTGHSNAWKNLYLAAGADVTAVGLDMTKIDFRNLQGASEVRIATAGGVPASVVGFTEALHGSSLNAGNFNASKRLFADGWARPQWRSCCASFAKMVTPPNTGARLWYTDDHIAFLRDDEKDQAQINATNAQALLALINTGFEADAAVDMVTAGDPQKLKGAHTGLLSVQLQPPGTVMGGQSDPNADPGNPDPPQDPVNTP